MPRTGKTITSSIAYLILLLGIMLPQKGKAQESCTQKLRNARNAYQEGKLSSLPTTLQSCIDNGFNKEEKIEALRLVTLAFLYEENEASAKKSYLQLLNLNPEYRPNPQADPTELILLAEKFDTDPKFFYGIKTGLAYSLVEVIEPTSDVVVGLQRGNYSFSYSMSFGVFFQYPINNKLSANAEFYYMLRSLSMNKNPMEGSDVQQQTISEDQRWIEMPILLNYKLPVNAFLLELTGGPSFHYLLLSEVTSEGGNEPFSDVDFYAQRNQFNLSGILGIRANFKVFGRNFLTTSILYQHRFMNEVNQTSNVLNQDENDRLLNSAYKEGQYKGHSIWLRIGLKLPYYNPQLK
ncbi:outer membrane beta-barrel protein [Marivirga atlantica]|jgi:hypothetical protein|uniref:PorT family protein n=1 Tax=Marivirga atlantica TaxID=1548457 RepID=A0A937DHL2_9BACT|nr:outer membrane beta-barrel protein [Marivirga atlantica]MBL0764120.1 PorT family protein [Marivirga atlantica]